MANVILYRNLFASINNINLFLVEDHELIFSLQVTDTIDIIQNPKPEPNLQLITCSVHGDIKVWDLKSEPIKVDTKKLVQQFKSKERFGRPASLNLGISPHSRLHRRWKPTATVSTYSPSFTLTITILNQKLNYT